MSAERGAHNEDEVRASLRMIPGLLRIWGGDGERAADKKDPPEVKQEDDKIKDDDSDDDDDDDGDGDDPEDKDKAKKKDDGPSLQDQLDDEKRARVKAEKALAKRNKAVEDAEADKDAVKDRDKYKAKVEARDKFLTANLIGMEISKQKKFDFIDVDDVIRAFKTDEVTIDLDDDEPTVEGLELALKRIAKEKPHFLKKAKEEEDDIKEPPSGSKAGGGKVESADAQSKRLQEKYKFGIGSHTLKVM